MRTCQTRHDRCTGDVDHHADSPSRTSASPASRSRCEVLIVKTTSRQWTHFSWRAVSHQRSSRAFTFDSSQLRALPEAGGVAGATAQLQRAVWRAVTRRLPRKMRALMEPLLSTCRCGGFDGGAIDHSPTRFPTRPNPRRRTSSADTGVDSQDGLTGGEP